MPNFPNSLPTLTNPDATSTTTSVGHWQQHASVNDEVEAIAERVGVTGDINPSSHEKKITDLQNTTTANSSSITTLQGQSAGWTNVTGTWTFNSSDSPTFKSNIPSGGLTKYNPGMRVKLDQTQALTTSYNFDSNSTDQKSGFNGTDTAITYTAGKFGNAATFNGTTSKVVLGANASLNLTSTFTVGMWFKTVVTGVNKTLFQNFQYNGNSNGFKAQIIASNVLNVEIGATNSGRNLLGKTNVCDGNWHYFVFTYNNGILQIYLDGVIEGSIALPAPTYPGTTYARIGMGSDSGTDINPMSGQIDDLFIINGNVVDAGWIKDKYVASSSQGTGDITLNKKFIITGVADTVLTLYGGTDYILQNSTISNMFYSLQKAPFEFPLDPARWSTEFIDIIDRVQTSPTINIWYNLGNLSITIPIGLWNVNFQCGVGGSANTSGIFSQWTTLSTANNSETDNKLTTYIALNAASGNTLYSAVTRTGVMNLTTKTTFYLNHRTTASAVPNINVLGAEGALVMRAVSAYL